MKKLKYTIIKTQDQYYKYCDILENLVSAENPLLDDEIALLTLLIETWDNQHSSFKEVDPITLLKYLMEERKMKAKDLVNLLGVSKGLVSDILNYKKGLSKEVIRILADHFKVSQEAFNRPYKLVNAASPKIKHASVVNPKKKLKIT